MGGCRTFQALCCKNLLVLKRRLCVPLVLTILALVITAWWYWNIHGSIVVDKGNPREPLEPLGAVSVRFAPPQPLPRRVMERLRALMPQADVEEVENESAIRDAWEKQRKLCGVLFSAWNSTSVAYTLLTPYPYDTDQPLSASFFDSAVYHQHPVAPLQVALDRAIADDLTHTESKEKVYAQEMTVFVASKKRDAVGFLVCLYSVLAYPMARFSAVEKEHGVKTLLGLLGASNLTMWLSWAAVIVPYLVLMAALLAGLAFVFQPFPATLAPLFVLLFLGMTACGAVYFFFAAVTVSVIIFDIVYSVAFIVPLTVTVSLDTKEPIPPALQLGLCLHPQFALVFGAWAIADSTTPGGTDGQGVAPPPAVPPGGMTLGGAAAGEGDGRLRLLWVWLALLLDIAVYFLLAVYLDPIVPGRYGAARRKDWPFAGCRKRRGTAVDPIEEEQPGPEVDARVEAAPPLEVAVSLNNLTKKYGRKYAVRGLNLDMYQGTVTALLGHNGAGKTTTVSMIAGVTSPSAGSLTIGGLDRAAVSQNAVALCPQEDLLLPQLNVEQHLELAAKLRGLDGRERKQSVQTAVRTLGLRQSLEKLPKQLSGGFKRRLSLAIAVAGSSQLLILDEPTAGTDPEVRHDIWDLISRLRLERTILLTTHLMEEADSLADRVAIIADGQLLCYGSSAFLRRQYGAGYLLRVHTRRGAAPAPLQAAVRAEVPGAQLREASPHQLVFAAPPGDTAALGRACADLERRRDQLGVEGVGLSASGLEEIYLRAMKFEESQAVKRFRESEMQAGPRRAVGWARLHEKLSALFRKELLYLLRYWALLLCLALVILLTVLLCCVLLRVTSTSPLPPLRLRSATYPGRIPYEAAAGAEPLGSRLEAAAAAGGGGPAYRVSDLRAHLRMRAAPAMAVNLSAGGAELTALFSSSGALFSLPVALALLGNALVRDRAGSDGYSIDSTLQPFLRAKELDYDIISSEMWTLFLHTLLIGWVAALAYPHLQERLTGFKRLQLAAGVPLPAYWLARFLCHMVISLVLAALVVGLVQAADVSGVLRGGESAGCLMLMLGLYFASCLPFFYLLGHAALSCYMLCAIIIGFLGIFTLLLDLNEESQYAWYIVLLLPTRNLLKALTAYWDGSKANSRCRQMTAYDRDKLCYPYDMDPCCFCPPGRDCGPHQSLFSAGMQTLMAYLAAGCLLFGGIVLLVDAVAARRSRRPHPPPPPEGEDEDVREERQSVQRAAQRLGAAEPMERRRARTTLAAGDALLAHDLAKTFRHCCGRTEALRGVSLRVRSGECFGLLGLNGAGKTTALRILVADLAPSAGEAFCRRHSLADCRHQFLRQLSYCPQTDPLGPRLTGYEQAALIAQMRGLRRADAEAEADLWLDVADLTEHSRQRSSKYSGGSKRKLSTVLALAGRPPLPMLDEPSAGVDPAARRNIAAALLAVRAAGHGLLFTSHSMSECESLCDRVAIQREGRIVCVGPLPHLKTKFRQGCWLTLQLATHEPERRQAVVQAVLDALGQDCQLRTELPMMLKFELHQRDLSWAELFASMERLVTANKDIASYSVSETSLEDIFLSFREGNPDRKPQSVAQPQP